MRFGLPVRKVILILLLIAFTAAGQYEVFHIEKSNKQKEATIATGAVRPIIAKKTPLIHHMQADTGRIQELTMQVRTIFAHNCTRCHGAGKAEGDLRLDTKEFIDKGGSSGAVLIAGKPEQSELIRRIKLPGGYPDAMPATGDRLSKEEIEVLEVWARAGMPWSEEQKSMYRMAALLPRTPELPPATATILNPVDRFVNVYFNNNKIEWAKPVNDRMYIRRVYLDVIGLLPSPDSVQAFADDKQPGKRDKLVKNLLSRNHDYTQHWLTFWNDELRNDYSGTGYITGGREDITRWLYNSLYDNKPYNLFVKELINPDSTSEGFIKGITWRGTINASQRTEMQAAQNISQVFLGLNLKCASCHDSFISDWKLDDAYAFANIFCDSAMEVNRCDKPTGRMAGRRILFKELGELDTGANKIQRLKQLSELITQPQDGRLYRTLVNRIWAQVMGRGFIEPLDVMDNAPWSGDLLDWLASDFTANGYDIKRLLFMILTSKTYQLPSVAITDPAIITSPNFIFKGMLRRRLTAEQFTDAVSVAIEPVYPDSAVVYEFLPDAVKNTVCYARASFVRNDGFLTALGRPNRETVSTSRLSQANLLQALVLTNGVQFNDALKRGAMSWKKRYPDSDKLIRAVYRNTLGRLPTVAEQKVAKDMLGTNANVSAIQDFLWAMTLHPEFQLIF